MDIYIKPYGKAKIIGRRLVYLKDIAEVYVGGQQIGNIGETVVFSIPEEQEKLYLLSVIDIIKKISNSYPNMTVSNVGEMDIIIEYLPKEKKENKMLLYSKVAFVFLVLMVGASTTIMFFHTDAQLPKVFQNYYYIFFGESNDMPTVMTIPYSIGLALGILVFFNHFSKFYLTHDPTPIDVEMTTYEQDTDANVIDTLAKEKKEKSGES